MRIKKVLLVCVILLVVPVASKITTYLNHSKDELIDNILVLDCNSPCYDKMAFIISVLK